MIRHESKKAHNDNRGLPRLSPGVLAHLFEPFISTMPVGKGIGLGLTISNGFV